MSTKPAAGHLSENPMTRPADAHTAETLHPAFVTSLSIDHALHDSSTDFQRIQIFENAIFGRVMTLDGVIQVTERDEFIYHEMLTHVPILAHGAVEHVLIIGGGDGGIAREALRHPNIKSVVMAELDPGVIALTQQHLPMIWGDAARDPRLRIVISDGAEFVRKEPRELFDVIIVDSTDPVGPAEVLFSNHFYAQAKRHLRENGILVTQNGVVFLQAEELAGSMRAFRSLFADASCYLAAIPSYTGGLMAFGWASDGDHRMRALDVIEQRLAQAAFGTRYYTPAIHKAAFILPPFVATAMR
jgi:spermidine synthase